VIAEDRLGHPDQAVLVTERPAIDVRVVHGLSLRVNRRRGLDIGAAWFRGIPIAWVGPAGEGGADAWIDRAPGVYALGLEPANCSVLGRAHDRAEGRLPFLEPGAERTTRIAVTAEEVE
jgi:hypothetical protein